LTLSFLLKFATNWSIGSSRKGKIESLGLPSKKSAVTKESNQVGRQTGEPEKKLKEQPTKYMFYGRRTGWKVSGGKGKTEGPAGNDKESSNRKGRVCVIARREKANGPARKGKNRTFEEEVGNRNSL